MAKFALFIPVTGTSVHGSKPLIFEEKQKKKKVKKKGGVLIGRTAQTPVAYLRFESFHPLLPPPVRQMGIQHRHQMVRNKAKFSTSHSTSKLTDTEE